MTPKKTESAQLPFTCKFSIELRRITYNTIRLFDTDTHMCFYDFEYTLLCLYDFEYTLSLSSSGFISVDAGGFQSVPAQPASSAFGSYRVFIIKVTKSPEHRAQLRIIIISSLYQDQSSSGAHLVSPVDFPMLAILLNLSRLTFDIRLHPKLHKSPMQNSHCRMF